MAKPIHLCFSTYFPISDDVCALMLLLTTFPGPLQPNVIIWHSAHLYFWHNTTDLSIAFIRLPKPVTCNFLCRSDTPIWHMYYYVDVDLMFLTFDLLSVQVLSMWYLWAHFHSTKFEEDCMTISYSAFYTWVLDQFKTSITNSDPHLHKFEVHSTFHLEVIRH